MSLLYLDSADVLRASDEVDVLGCVAGALAQHHAGTATVPHEAVLRWDPAGGGAARTLAMPGMLDGPEPVIGTKIINASTENPARGLPRADGVTLLFDPVTARPRALMQGAHLSALRTAAVSTLAAQRLRASGADTLAVVGAGPIGRTHVALMVEHLGLPCVLLSDQAPDRAERLAAELRSGLAAGLEVTAVAEPEAAVRRADVVVAATTTTTPYISYRWLAPGAVIVNVSLDDVDEEAFVRASRLYVDDWDLIVADDQRLLGRLARAGTIVGPGRSGGGRPVDGTLGHLLAGTCPGRADDHEIMLVNPFGMSIGDVALAAAVYEVARRRGYGTWLDT